MGYQKHLRLFNPEEFEAREEELREQGMLVGDQIEIEFEIGNHYQYIKKGVLTKSGKSRNYHRWTAFVRLKNLQDRPLISHLVDHVEFDINDVQGWKIPNPVIKPRNEKFVQTHGPGLNN